MRTVGGKKALIITTTDPITGEHLHNLQSKPYVIEGSGPLAVKIYFESEDTRRTYIEAHHEIPRDTAGQGDWNISQ